MIPNPVARTKGGAAQVGVIPGLEHIGPFGPYADDDQEQPAMASLADDRIAQQLEAARARRERRQHDRAQRSEARRHGLTARHRRKLAYLDAREATDNRTPALSGAS